MFNPLKYEKIELDELSGEEGLVFVNLITFTNAVYKGQIKPILNQNDMQNSANQDEFTVDGISERGIKQGFGIQIWNDGAKYRGNWLNNMANGTGVFWHPEGDKYEGEFKEDKSNGYGVYTCADGTKYEGHWKDDNQHGQCSVNWPDGSTFVGNFIDGVKDGYGTWKSADGFSYGG